MVAVPHFSTTTKVMNKVFRSLPFDLSVEKFRESYWALLDELGVKTAHNGVSKLQGWKNKLAQLEAEIEEIKQDWCSLTGVKNYAAARKRTIALMKNAELTQSPVKKFNLDISFLQGVGARWDKIAEGKDEIRMVENLNKKLTRQRNIVEEYYFRFLDRVALYCEKEQMEEGETQEQVERWHTAMVEDFDLLTAGEFFEKYYGDSHDLTVFPKENESVLLVDALPLVREYAPARLYQELIIETETIGYVTRHTFNAWDKIAAGVTQMPHKEAVKTMRELMMKVIGTAAHRSIKGPESLPNLGVESNTLVMLLAHPDDNPYSREFEINNETSLLEFVKKYLEFSQV